MNHSPPPDSAPRSTQGRRPTAAPDLQLPEGDAPIERKVYDALRYALMSGRMMPGQMLTSRSLSDMLGVSHTPIMAALKRLEADKVLEGRNRSAFYVSEPDRDEFREILDIRLVLEVMALRRAVRNITPETLARLRVINQSWLPVGTIAEGPATLPAEMLVERKRAALAANFRFHFEIYRHCGSATLVDLIERFWLRIGPMLHRYFASDNVASMTDAHEEILRALENSDAEGAELALRYDLNTAFTMIVPQLSRTGGG
ncbi:GntR family transcriptional regulator [Tabrizicola sp. M-4]